ncbi:MAG TPA: phytanoyl-CoA dioxygenase family protein [Candidatus Elarobacter sp.]|jgi:hypothetical protein|nr:phytanoyl-CoA dioxygenase family protein [Candidatus Elarobacter sp.]
MRLDRPSIGVPHLRSLWSRTVARARGTSEGADAAGQDEHWARDRMVIYGLGLGLRETYDVLYGAPSFEAFERWILEAHGGMIDQRIVARVNAALSGNAIEPIDDGSPSLRPDELAFFDEHGYVVLQNAVSPDAARAAEDAIWAYLRMDRDDPETWYADPYGRSLWVPLIHHPALDANRASGRIASAFAQLWKRRDLWVTVDQTGFNPPERPDWQFPGQRLHWDVSLTPPIPFGLLGILYLTDTPADGGAFTCVPGFHRRLEAWLHALPPEADPREQDLSRLGPIPVAAGCGDLVIWHQALPHGASPNRSARPRIVQYIALTPLAIEDNSRWS